MMDDAPALHIESLYEQSVALLRADSKIVPFSLQLAALTNNAARVQLIHQLLLEQDILPKRPPPSKDAQVSSDHRNSGNKLYQQKQDKKALECYNRAVAWAPINSKELSLAYGNRSAVLCSMKKYDKSLLDISRALDSGYDESLKPKLLKRQATCENAPRNINHNNIQEVRDRIFAPPLLRNPRMPCASANLELSYNTKSGRCVIANDDIKPGTVLAIDKPYLVLLLEPYYLIRCYHCLENSIAMIPCENCSLIMFCNEECRNRSWDRYHKYECPLMRLTSSMGFTKIELLALRTVIRARCDHKSWDDLISTCRIAEAETDFNLKGFVDIDSTDSEKVKVYDSKYYTSIHMLETNVTKRCASDLFQKAVSAAVFLHFLKEFTTIFPKPTEVNVDPSTVQEYINFAGGLLLHHIMTSASNMHSLEGIVEDRDHDFLQNAHYGSGAYAFLSLLNHSCAPNVGRLSVGTSMILLALRPIKKGQQIFDNYGCHHAMQAYEQRQKSLEYQYKFKCECEACKNRWPLYHSLPFGHPRKDLENFTSILSSDFIEKLKKGDRTIVLEKLDILYQHVALLEDTSPCKDLANYQETIKQCWSLFGNVMYYDG